MVHSHDMLSGQLRLEVSNPHPYTSASYCGVGLRFYRKKDGCGCGEIRTRTHEDMAVLLFHIDKTIFYMHSLHKNLCKVYTTNKCPGRSHFQYHF